MSLVRFGDFEVHLLTAGGWYADGGSLFGVVPKLLWEKQKPADSDNLVRCACVAAVIRHRGRVVVCETGIGTKLDEKLARRYRIWEPEGLLGSLRRLGVRPEEVDLVLTTHLHWDHAGGLTRRGPDGRYEITFPRARHVVQKSEWDFALAPDPRSRAAYFDEDLLPVADAGLLEIVDGETEVIPGLWVRRTGGHTPGHQLVVFRASPDLACAITGDLVGLRPHLRLPWIPAADLDVLRSVEEKARLLEEAASHRWLLVLGHETEHPAGYLGAEGAWIPEEGFDVSSVPAQEDEAGPAAS
ncbi:MAG: MBL fold metallo-hydrolase [Candidatus Nephthysia bennettiae]|uniref:MBL fold metallo-hydrolase n=1 Tax=Candidatus Nephthysia bennettiae TaxID=3127016 RepID=A0A934KA54_9BACT|nr:MBL fold metallo-hydrolase [Candidatus Dormibacteraeota bacterium]MBJ7611137.1 MBL fold metallo-hydrolase [Candidatus Dormibacteraeota bacterium]PZR90656.1 MAG: MBL fold metallo-hydrolase [Candidatus Dormibacteraeota bacterium]